MKYFNKLWHVIFIVNWPLFMLRLCSQLSKNSVHLNSHKDAVLCSCVLPSSRFEGSLARLVSTQVPSLHSWILWRGCGYLGVNISEDLTWTTHIQTQVKKARQRLYHLRQLRKFRVSPAILKTFCSGTIESVLTQCISVWYGNSYNQDCKALQRVVRLAKRLLSPLCRTSTSNAAKAELQK